MISKTKYTGAFTLVELIVVITILAILWTLWFISFQWYTISARDSSRITEVRSIAKMLDLYKLKTEIYPLPDNSININASWSLVGYQWFAGKSVFGKIWYSNEWVDPLTKWLYTYYTLPNGRAMQLFALMEKKSLVNVFETTWVNAALEERFPMVYWSRLWIVTSTWNVVAQNISGVTDIDLTNGAETYTVHVNNDRQYQWSWNDLRYWVPLSSCQRLLDANLAWANWYYTIYPIADEPKEVYCRFEDNEWYTLVARAVDNVSFNNTPFGWFVSTGDIRNDNIPYSLGEDITNIPFEDVYIEVVWEWKERSNTPWLNWVTVLNVTDIDLFDPANIRNSIPVNDCAWGGCPLFNRWGNFGSQESYYLSPTNTNLNSITDLSDLPSYSWNQRDGLNRRRFWASFPHAGMIFVK